MYISYPDFKKTPEAKVLAVFSGGLDSTATLYRLLTDTSAKVSVLRVINPSLPSAGIERDCAAKAIEYLQGVRSFDFTERNAETSESCWLNNLVLTVARFIKSNAPDTTHVAYGANRADLGVAGVLEMVRRVRDTVFYPELADLAGGAPSVIYPTSDLSKKEMEAMMPAELLALTWSCQRPKQNGRPCGFCSSCRQRKLQGVAR